MVPLMILRNWKLFAVIGGVIVVGIFLYMWREEIQNAAYQAFFAKIAEETNRQNLEEIEKLKQANEDLLNQIEEATEKRNDINRRTDDTLRMIEESTPEDDGPLAPVLRETMRRIARGADQ